MTISHVSGTPATSETTPSTAPAITLSSSLQGQDRVYIVTSFNQSVGTVTAPAGWLQVASLDVSTTMRIVVWRKIAAGSIGVASSDAGTTVTLTDTASAGQRHGTGSIAYRGVGAEGAIGVLAETTSRTGHPSASCTSAADGSLEVVFMCERSLTPSTTVTQPSGRVRWGQAFSAAGGTVSAGVAIGDSNTTRFNNGTTVGGGTWTADVANSAWGSITLSLTPAGATVTLAASPGTTVSKGTAVTCTATESGTSGTVTRSWTQLSGPSVTLSGASTTTASFTPSVAGTVVLQYSCTDSNGTTTVTITITVNDTVSRPISDVTPGWSAVGGASIAAVLADESDSTLAAGAGSGTVYEVLMAPMSSPPTVIQYSTWASDATKTTTVVTEVRMGTSTSIAGPWTDVVTTNTPGQDIAQVLSPAQQAACTNLSDLRLRQTVTIS